MSCQVNNNEQFKINKTRNVKQTSISPNVKSNEMSGKMLLKPKIRIDKFIDPMISIRIDRS